MATETGLAGRGTRQLEDPEGDTLHNPSAFHLHFCLMERAKSRPFGLRGNVKSSKRGKGKRKRRGEGEGERNKGNVKDSNCILPAVHPGFPSRSEVDVGAQALG